MNRFTLGNVSFDERRQAARFLRGSGIEIGGSYLAIPVDKRCCRVQYVDKMTASEIATLFPEVQRFSMVETDIVCDVQKKGLSLFADKSQDFVIVSHLVEHLPDPLGFIKDSYRVLRPNGVFYLVVPDKNFTFDREREVTPLAHIVEDMKRNTQDVDESHLEDWLRHIRNTTLPEDAGERKRVVKWELERSIHVHVWAWDGMVEFLRYLMVNEGIVWELCEFYLPKKGQDEVIFVLRKIPGLPEEAVVRFDATLETLLARENAMKAVVESFQEHAAASARSAGSFSEGSVLGLKQVFGRMKRRLVERSGLAPPGDGGKAEAQRARSAYKTTWTELSGTVEEAKMHVTGYVEEDRIQTSAEETRGVLLATVGVHPEDVVLEIGCGIGRVGQVIAPLCGQWIGCDVSPNMLKHAAERLRDLRNVRFLELSGYDLAPVGDQSVDMVYCTVVFMHLEEWDRYRYILEAYRVLRPGGRIYIDNFNLCGDEGWAVFERTRKIVPEKRSPHISVSSTPQEIEMFLRRAGFHSVTVESHPLWARGWGRK